MFILQLVLLILGIILIGFGYFIHFKKKYNLINNFQEDFKSNRFDESYADRVGLIELIWGIIFIILFFITRLKPDYSVGILLISAIGLIVSLLINYSRSSRK